MAANIRNVRFNHAGTIDVEIEHPDNGWLPATLSPDDAAVAALYEAALLMEPAAYIAPPVVITDADIKRARDRRLTSGAILTVTAYAEPIAIRGLQSDLIYLAGFAQTASLRLARGDTSDMTFRDAANVKHAFSPLIGLAMAATPLFHNRFLINQASLETSR